MAEYVKICPVCGYKNSEDSDVCIQDKVYLGMVPTVREEDIDSISESVAKELVDNSEQPAALPTVPEPDNKIQFKIPAVLYLEIDGMKQVFPVKPGDIAGQAYPGNTASIQISDVPFVKYVHRQHCQFDVQNSEWTVTALDQGRFGKDFTNPTRLNGELLKLGTPYPLKQGDQLVLGKLTLNLRLIKDE